MSEVKGTSELKSVNQEPYVPQNWTILHHGTNLIKHQWQGGPTPFTSDDVLEIGKTNDGYPTLGLSVIDSRMKASERSYDPGSDTIDGYSDGFRPKGMSEEEFTTKSKPFEIRVVFLDDTHYCRKEILEKYGQAILDKVNVYYQDNRHPRIPLGTRLIKLAHIQEKGRDVFYYVPEDVKSLWLKAVEDEKRTMQKDEKPSAATQR